jgi:hypothetical protein
MVDLRGRSADCRDDKIKVKEQITFERLVEETAKSQVEISTRSQVQMSEKSILKSS